jgi:hypothetical protein
MIPLLREQVAEEIMGLTIVADNDPRRGQSPFVCRDDLKSYDADDTDADEVRVKMEQNGFTFVETNREVCFRKGSISACSDDQPRPKAICIAALRAARKEKDHGVGTR